jgi:RNA polymerase sigma-70 factor, ECF subfamily
MGQRITRAKNKIKAAHIPYKVPEREDLPLRVSGVLAVLFLVFNEGYLSSGSHQDAVRSDLTTEAIRLTRLVGDLLPEDVEVVGLLALMLLIEARRAARVSGTGELVRLDEQDRGACARHPGHGTNAAPGSRTTMGRHHHLGPSSAGQHPSGLCRIQP